MNQSRLMELFLRAELNVVASHQFLYMRTGLMRIAIVHISCFALGLT